MTLMKSLIAAMMAFALAGVAVGAPTQRDHLGNAETAKPQPDLAALYRPAQVGECAAISRPRTNAARPTRKQDAKFSDRKTMAHVACNAVWND